MAAIPGSCVRTACRLAAVAVLAGLATTGSAGIPSVAPAATIAARPADDFVDSLCVATHWSYPDTPYVSRYVEAREKLVASGIRHIRDGGTGVAGPVRELAQRGVRTTFIMDPRTGTSPGPQYWSAPPGIPIVDFVKAQGGAIDAVEILSEIDLYVSRGYFWRPGDTSPVTDDPASALFYAGYARALARDTRAALRADPATAGVAIYGPAMFSESAYDAVGDLTDAVDAASLHWFLAGRHPETDGWGDNGYGSRAWQVRELAGVQAPGKPFVATEGGYSNAVARDPRYPPEQVTARYLPRLFLHAFNGGFKRFCAYELIDQLENPGRDDEERNFGLLRHDLSEKPTYTAIKSLSGLLADPGPAFTPKRLGLSLNGQTAEVEQTLLQKRDGRFFAALWLSRESWDPIAGGEKAVQAQEVTLGVPASITRATAHRLDERGAIRAERLTVRGGRIALRVQDEVTVVELGPGHAGRPVLSGTVRSARSRRPSARLSLRRAKSGQPISQVTLALPAAAPARPSALRRRLTLRADGRRVPRRRAGRRSYVLRGSRTLRIGTLRAPASRLSIGLPSGTLRGSRRLRRSRSVPVRATVTDSRGQRTRILARVRVRR